MTIPAEGAQLSHDDLAVALILADQADAVTLARFGALDLQVDTKPDLTPVSDADRSVETGLRGTLGRARPTDSILGEEFGGSTTLAGRQWIIDSRRPAQFFKAGQDQFLGLRRDRKAFDELPKSMKLS